MPVVKIKEFRTNHPNIVVCHSDNTTGIKRIGKDGKPRDYLYPWGNADKLLEKFFGGKMVDVRMTAAQKMKRSQHNYIKNKTFYVKDLAEKRMEFCYPKKEKYLKHFLETFPDFIKQVHGGKVFTTNDLEKHPYYEYLTTRLAKEDLGKEKGKRHVFNKMRDAIKLYNDIKKHGLKAPLDMWIENNRFVLYRGGRRFEIIKILGYKKVAARIFKTKQMFRNLNPDVSWKPGNPDDSIHGLGIKQFMELGDRATDKYWVHGYTKIYDKEIAHLRNRKKIKILEIGVKRGMSLKLWKDYFKNATVYGIDIDEKTKVLPYPIFIGSQNDVNFLKDVGKSGPFDLIVDDGSHIPKDQLASFNTLWPFVTSKGYYVIEDMHWNYRTDKDKSMINRCKDMVNKIYMDPEVLSVNFYYNICFIRKV